jgi:hypothetical protein
MKSLREERKAPSRGAKRRGDPETKSAVASPWIATSPSGLLAMTTSNGAQPQLNSNVGVINKKLLRGFRFC